MKTYLILSTVVAAAVLTCYALFRMGNASADMLLIGASPAPVWAFTTIATFTAFVLVVGFTVMLTGLVIETLIADLADWWDRR